MASDAPGGSLDPNVILNLPEDRGERFDEEWKITRARIERVAAAAVPRETEPAGAPRLDRVDWIEAIDSDTRKASSS